ncbi:MAG: aspartyl protease family protein [Candidatus Eremiobacteraeota bacterium]|nr:aspartyl protease family protein [Candidatus Eremiobacteraeota bacterium]
MSALLAQSRTALGGPALDRIHILYLSGRVAFAGLKGTGEEWLEIGKLRFAEMANTPPVIAGDGYDGKDVWNSDGSGLVWVDGGGAGRAGEISQAFAGNYALWTADRGGATVAWGGEKTNSGKAYDTLDVTAPGSPLPFKLWFDRTTHLPVRFTQTIGPRETITTFSDYRAVQGLMVPFASHSESNDGNSSDSVTTKAVADPADGASHLTKPASNVRDYSIAGGASSTSVPFDLADNHVYLDVKLNGKGPYRFIYDSGGANIVDASVAQEIGAAGKGSEQGSGVGSATESLSFALVDTMQFGAATVKNQLFGVAPTRAGFGISGGQRVDGLIGFEMLARFVTTFDYANGRVIFQMPDGASAPAGGQSLPFVLDGRQPQFACTIDGVSDQCTLDTGARDSMTFYGPFLAAHPTVVPKTLTAPGVNGFGFGGPAMGRLGRVASLQIGTMTLKDVVGDYTTQDKGAFAMPFLAANVGGNVWRRFTLTLDYGTQTMTLAPNAAFDQPDVYERAGLFLINRNGKYTVLDARPGTAAAQAGIVRGDVIDSIDGKSTSDMSLQQVRQTFFGAPGTALRLVLTGKDGAQRTVTLTLRDFV